MYLRKVEALVARTETLLGPEATYTSSASSTTATSTSSFVTPTSLLPHSYIISTQSSTATPAATDAAVSKSAATGHKSNTGPIVGGVIGGVVFIALCAGLLWFCLRMRKQREIDALVRDSTPILGSPANGNEKFAMEHSPDLGESGKRQSGGVFGPFGGYHRTPSVEIIEERGPSIDIGDTIRDTPLPDPEKTSLVAPPEGEHPALHPLPGVSSETPTYYPGGIQHPAYNTLPSQRGRHPTHVTLPGQEHIPETSPEIPDFEFSPVVLMPQEQLDNLDSVPLTPQAELAAFPSPPKTLVSHLSNLKRQPTPPRNARPHRRSTPPRMSLPLTRLTPPPTSDPTTRPSPRKSHSSGTSLQLSTLYRHPTPLPQRPRTLTYPSPTAGGRPELLGSLPIARTPKNIIPAFHHISLPSPQEPLSASSICRNESTTTCYSFPPAASGTPESNYSEISGSKYSDTTESKYSSTPESKYSDTPGPRYSAATIPSSKYSSTPESKYDTTPESYYTDRLDLQYQYQHPVTSDAHHLREQPSYVSALSVARDLQNASAVSALTSTSEEEEGREESSQAQDRDSERTPLNKGSSPNSKPEPEQQNNQSWQTYPTSNPNPTTPCEVSPMFSPPLTAGAVSIVSPLFTTPPLPSTYAPSTYTQNSTHPSSTQTTPSFLYTDPLPSMHRSSVPLLGNAGAREKGKRRRVSVQNIERYGNSKEGNGKEAQDLNIKVGLTPLIGAKSFSVRSLEQRETERREKYGDLKVLPLKSGKMASIEKERKKGLRKNTVPLE